MPLPATIHANVRWPSFRAAPHAIVETGGNLYVVALGSAAASSGHIAAWKSTDGGETWAEVDSADRITGIAGDSFAAVASGTTIHVAYQLLSDTAVRVRPFDCATEQWGTATGAGPALTANVGANAHVTGQIALFLCVRRRLRRPAPGQRPGRQGQLLPAGGLQPARRRHLDQRRRSRPFRRHPGPLRRPDGHSWIKRPRSPVLQ
jgi:hypothetical protein